MEVFLNGSQLIGALGDGRSVALNSFWLFLGRLYSRGGATGEVVVPLVARDRETAAELAEMIERLQSAKD